MVLLAAHAYAVLVTQTHSKPHRPISDPEVASVRKFVQGFYDWYVPRALKNGDTELLALKSKAASFAPELRSSLLEDWKASSKNKDEIVGLDFDPFLNSQDPYPRYTVATIKHQGQNWLVGVYGFSPGEKPTEPAVTAKVEKGKRGWRFTNFLYGKGDNLLGTLRQLKHDRKH